MRCSRSRARARFPRPLDLLCTCLLAGQEGRRLDDASAAALADPSADLVGFARLAGRHCVTPMLAACVCDPQLRPRLPEDFTLYLDFVYTENRRRNGALRRQLARVAACLNRAGIEPLLLKGAVRLADGLYRDPGWRFMRDLDLLIARDRLSDATASLQSLGYGFTRDAAQWPAQHRHLPPLARAGEAAVVEIHTELLPERQALCPVEQVLARSRAVDVDGAQVRVPEIADQLAHLIGHDRCDGYLRRSGTFLLRSLFEAALLCREGHAVSQLLARAAGAGLGQHAQVQLGLAARLFPEHVVRRPEPDLGERLQTHALIALERFDQSGRLRRVVWFGRLLVGTLLRSPSERTRLAANILSLDYHLHSARRLHRMWTSH